MFDGMKCLFSVLHLLAWVCLLVYVARFLFISTQSDDGEGVSIPLQ